MKKAHWLTKFLIAFTFVFVTACSGGTTPPVTEPGGGQTAENPPSQDQKEPEPPAEEERKIDMGGETLKILHWVDGPNEETPEGALALEKWKEAEEKYNVKIVWEKVPWGESVQMVTNAALSGESVGDIVALDYYFAVPAINQGLFMPVDNFFDYDDPKWPVGIKKHGMVNGKMYGFTANINNASGLYYNRTLFEREGLPDPHELVAQDKWDWDAFLDIAKRATKDTDGDGVIDQYGITNNSAVLARILIHSNGAALIEEKDGKHEFAYKNPDVIEALRFLYDLYNTHKVIAPKVGDNEHKDSQMYFNTGKAAMVTGEVWEGSTRESMTDEQGFVFFPKGPKGKQYQGSVENYVQFYIPANVKRAEEKAYIWDQIQTWDRVEQANRESAEQQLLADEQDVNAIMEVLKYTEPVFLPLNGVMSEIPAAIIRGESPETILERNKQVAQEGIDTHLNTKVEPAK